MARPSARELTERELEVMNVFWGRPDITAADACAVLADRGLRRSYTTIANLVKLLVEKGFLEATNKQRPFLYRPVRTQTEVSRSLVGDFINRVFGGSRQALLQHLMDERPLSEEERELLAQFAQEDRT